MAQLQDAQSPTRPLCLSECHPTRQTLGKGLIHDVTSKEELRFFCSTNGREGFEDESLWEKRSQEFRKTFLYSFPCVPNWVYITLYNGVSLPPVSVNHGYMSTRILLGYPELDG